MFFSSCTLDHNYTPRCAPQWPSRAVTTARPALRHSHSQLRIFFAHVVARNGVSREINSHGGTLHVRAPNSATFSSRRSRRSLSPSTTSKCLRLAGSAWRDSPMPPSWHAPQASLPRRAIITATSSVMWCSAPPACWRPAASWPQSSPHSARPASSPGGGAALCAPHNTLATLPRLHLNHRRRFACGHGEALQEDTPLSNSARRHRSPLAWARPLPSPRSPSVAMSSPRLHHVHRGAHACRRGHAIRVRAARRLGAAY